MGLFNWSKKTSNNITEEMIESRSTDWIDSILEYLNNSGNSLSPNYLENYSSLYTVANIRGETLGKLPLHLYKIDENGDKIKYKDDPRYDVLHYQFNEYTSSYTGLSTLEINRCKQGNTFARIWRNKGTGILENLELITPDRVNNYGLFNGHLWYHMYNPNTKKYEDIPSRDILHFKMLSEDGLWGKNPLTALKYNTSTSIRALMTLEGFYKNNAMSNIFFEHNLPPEIVNDKNFQEMMNDWNRRNSGANNFGQAKLTPPGTKIVTPNISFADAEMIETFKFNSNMVASLYQVPPFLVGDYEASKFASVEQLMLAFKAQAVSAMVRNYRQELEMKLLSLNERKMGVSIEFNINSMLEADFAAKADAYQKNIQNGVLNRRYVAELEGFPTEGLTDEYYVSNNHIPVSDLLERKAVEVEKMKVDIERLKSQSK
jgi:HK97 family phage portal protein